jgi:transposase
MQNSNQIFELALGLTVPWFIKNIEIQVSEKGKQGQIDIYIDFVNGTKFKDDNEYDQHVYDTTNKTWQHLNFFQHTCYLHARIPRLINKEGHVHTLNTVPWAREGSKFTLLFEAFSMLLIESEMPITKAANIMRVYPQRIWSVFNFWINKAFSGDIQSDITSIGIDETSSKKGHNYVTVAVDLKQNRVLFATPGKGAECIVKIKEHLELKGTPKEQIKQASIDMSPAFISGIMSSFPNAEITFDKFHVVKVINEAMDTVRRLESAEFDMLKGHKYTFLKNNSNLNSKQKEDRYGILNLYPTIANAFRLKEMFRELWEFKNIEDAGGFLAYWCDLVDESGIEPFKKAARTIMAHWSGIVNYAKSKINNGVLEGINSKIQLAKKRARGYRNIQNFINMIYFISGKLKFDYPQYFT